MLRIQFLALGALLLFLKRSLGSWGELELLSLIFGFRHFDPLPTIEILV
jgi:hypothetical protein